MFDRFDTPSFLKQEVTIAKDFPAIYVSDRDEVFCYTGILFKSEQRNPSINNSSWRLHGKLSTDKQISASIKEFFRIMNGCIVIDNYIDNHWTDAEYKLVDKIIRLPVGAQTYYGVVEHSSFKEDKELTRSAFGLSFHEIQDVLTGYAKIFGIYNDYMQYPRLTRSVSSDNYCDLTDLWIPKQFPYIAFEESSYLYSHVSLWGFYNHLSLLMFRGKKSAVYQAFLDIGVAESTMNGLLHLVLHDDTFYTVRQSLKAYLCHLNYME